MPGNQAALARDWSRDAADSVGVSVKTNLRNPLRLQIDSRTLSQFTEYANDGVRKRSFLFGDEGKVPVAVGTVVSARPRTVEDRRVRVRPQDQRILAGILDFFVGRVGNESICIRFKTAQCPQSTP